FNGVGSFIAPILGGQFILSGIEHSPEELDRMNPVELDSYLQFEADMVKLPYMAIAGAVLFLLLLFVFVKLPEIKDRSSDASSQGRFSFRVFRHNHLLNAVVAQFFYVGAQVGVGSFFIRFAAEVNGMSEKDAAFIWGSLAMVGFMLGRFLGTFLMTYIKPARLLSLFAVINVGLLILALTLSSEAALYSVIATPLFMSIMYP